jgi:hypothetical protein
MRFSEGEPDGRFVELYHSEIFSEREEVIVFTREDFERIYTSIQKQVDYITLVDLHLDRGEDWKLIGYWPKIMQGVNRIDLNMDLLFRKDALQSYLDAYLYDPTVSSQDTLLVSEKEAVPKAKPCTLDLFY